jgi:hypothetical protein
MAKNSAKPLPAIRAKRPLDTMARTRSLRFLYTAPSTIYVRLMPVPLAFSHGHSGLRQAIQRRSIP